MPDAARKWLHVIDNSLDYPAPMVYGPEFDRAVYHLRRLLEQNERLEAKKEELSIRYNHACDRIDRDIRGKQLEADLKERTEQYHLAHAKILSREAINEDLGKDYNALQRQVERLPGIKIADGTVWLVFPGAIISIDAIGAGRGPIVKKNLRAWRDKILEGDDDNTISSKEALEMDDDEWIGFLGIGGDDAN